MKLIKSAEPARTRRSAGSIAILFAAFAVVALGAASCTGNSTKTKLVGTVSSDDFDEVNIAVDKYAIDTLVPVIGGKFSIDLPADPTEIAFVAAGYYRSYFILDGTKLHLALGDDSSVTSSSKKSIQNRYNDFEEHVTAMNNDFLTQVSALGGDEGDDTDEAVFEELYNSAVDGIVTYIEQIVYDNRDNAISAVAVNKLNGIVPDEQLDYLIGTLSEEMQQSSFITPLVEELALKAETAEGMPFKDFTAEDPAGKAVSLSDYVGRGKYVIVDFWASWCPPCKEEIPYIKAVYAKYRSKGLDVVSVAVSDDPQDTRDTAKVYGLTWNQIVGGGQLPAQVYGFNSIPQIMLVGPDGVILKKGLRGEEIEAEVAKYLK